MKENREKKLKKSGEEDADGDDGIFGGCCSRFDLCSSFFNCFFIYFLYGIIWVNIFLRLVCLMFIIIYILVLFFLVFIRILFYIVLFLNSFLFYDLDSPKSLNYPIFIPFIQIFLILPILSLIKIFVSLIRLVIEIIKYIFIKI